MALNGLYCADVPLSNYSLTHLNNSNRVCLLFECFIVNAVAESYPEVDLSLLSDAFSALTKQIFRDLIFTTNLRFVSSSELFYCHRGTTIGRVHPVHLMNAEQHPVPPTCGPSQLLWAADPPIGSYSVYIHHHHLLLLSSKADTHFTVQWRVEVWVDLCAWLHNEMVYLSADSHPSK